MTACYLLERLLPFFGGFAMRSLAADPEITLFVNTAARAMKGSATLWAHLLLPCLAPLSEVSSPVLLLEGKAVLCPAASIPTRSGSTDV